MKTLRYGDEGLYVQYLQVLLKRAGEEPGNADGIFGRRTFRAVTAFQSSRGLLSDGIVGRLTWASLYPYLIGSTITVLSDRDTVETIAEQFHASVSAIRTANPDAEFLPGQSIVVPMPTDIVFADVAYSSFLTAAVIEGLCLRYPFIKREVIGSSVSGKAIEMIRLGDGAFKLGVNASHHANEWITTPLTLMFAEKYAQAYAEGGRIADVPARSLYEKSAMYLVPLVNPDGVDLVTGAFEAGDSYYESAKALAGYYPSVPFPSGWKANILGIDLNLGYPAGWEQARAIKFAQGYTRPGPRDYVGTRALETPENRVIYELTRREQFDRTIAYHTQGGEIYYEYMGEAPRGSYALAQRFADVSGYSVASVPYGSGFAGYKDWFISAFQRSGFTIEAGRGENPLPIQDLSHMYLENEGIFVTALSENTDT